jgi:hypothetical protein
MRLRLAPLVLGVALALGASIGVGEGPAWAGPDPSKLKAAAESFEAGARAFKDKKYQEAAAHFEAADSAVPGAKALRLAIRARDEAGQSSRAATLAALALDRYADDSETRDLANEVIGKYGKALYKVEISCASPCLLAVGTHIVHGEAATRRVIYVEPGSAPIGASFIGNLTAPEQTVKAVAGGSTSVRFAPAKDAGGPAPGPGPDNPPTGEGGASTTGTGGAAGTGGAPATSGAGGDTSAGGDSGGGTETPPADDDWRITPVPFFIGLAVTAGLGGATIWSGVDTLNNPGTDAVRAACAGQSTDCPLYQDGEAAELRTNVLIGATAGAAALTVIFAIVSDWDGDPEPSDASAEAAGVHVDPPRLWVTPGNGNERGNDRAAAFGATVEGRF